MKFKIPSVDPELSARLKASPDALLSAQSGSRNMLWESNQEKVLHSERSTTDIGLFGLKVALTLNGGALVALVSLYPNVIEVRGVASYVSNVFLIGLALGTISVLIGYLYKSLQTKEARDRADNPNVIARNSDFKWVKRLSWIVAVPAVLSLIFFMWGTSAIVGSLSEPVKKERVLRTYIKHFMPDLKLTDTQLKILDQYDQLNPEQRRAVRK